MGRVNARESKAKAQVVVAATEKAREAEAEAVFEAPSRVPFKKLLFLAGNYSS